MRVLSASDTKGKEWTKIDGSMKTLSVGPTGVCWAVDQKVLCFKIRILICRKIFLTESCLPILRLFVSRTLSGEDWGQKVQTLLGPNGNL